MKQSKKPSKNRDVDVIPETDVLGLKKDSGSNGKSNLSEKEFRRLNRKAKTWLAVVLLIAAILGLLIASIGRG